MIQAKDLPLCEVLDSPLIADAFQEDGVSFGNADEDEHLCGQSPESLERETWTGMLTAQIDPSPGKTNVVRRHSS